MEGEEAILGVLEGVSDLYVTRGRRVLHFDLSQERPSRDELLALMMGRSGKLRSPAIRTGSRLLVGYSPELLETTLL